MDIWKAMVLRDPLVGCLICQSSNIQDDSSSTGLGVYLLEENQPVAYSDMSLTGHREEVCADREGDALSIVYAAEYFHLYNL